TTPNIIGYYTDDLFATQLYTNASYSGMYYGQYGCSTLLVYVTTNAFALSSDGGFSWRTPLTAATMQSNDHYFQFGDNACVSLIRTNSNNPRQYDLTISDDGGETWDRNVATLYSNCENIAFAGSF